MVSYALAGQMKDTIMGKVKYNEEMKLQTVEYVLEGGQICDQGRQGAWNRYLAENDIEGSMSAPGCPYDYFCVESFFATLKEELTCRRKYATIEDEKTDLYRYIELFYNRKRLHSTLDYMSPVVYRLANSQ